MRILIEDVEGSNYFDIVLSEKEIHKMKFGEMVTGEIYFHGRKLYVGIYEIKDLVYEKESSQREFENQEDDG